MKINVTVLMVIVLILMIMGPAASAGSATDTSHSIFPDVHMASSLSILQSGVTVGNADLYDFSIDNALFALYANSDGLTGKTPYISRARGLIDQNENRNRVMQYIADNPGSKQYDMTGALDMNIGTLRYHLMILGLNHRVVSYQDGARLVRYFVNNGTYSPAQMEVISLLKRNPTSKLLSALAGNSGMTGAMISTVSGLPYCEVNKYLKELMAKDVVVKESLSADRYQYRIAPGREDYIVRNIRQRL
jgi:predicted transcriptional regulator